MGDPRTDGGRLLALVRRLARRARMDRAIRRGSVGLFFGLLPGCLVVLLAGTVPLPALPIACGCAAVGLAAGALSGLLGRVDRRRLLIRADGVLGSKELTSTGYELARAGDGREDGMAAAVVEDAADLLGRRSPRRILGRVRPPFAALLPVCVALIVLGLLFPVDFRALFPPHDNRPVELAMIGDDLRGDGERIREAARAGDVGRSLALSQELAQLGSEMAERGLDEEEALARMSDLEARIGAAYQLRLEQVLREARERGDERSGAEAPDARSRSGEVDEGEGGAESGEPSAADSDQELKDLGGMRDSLNDARRRLQGEGGGEGGAGKGSGGQPPDSAPLPDRPGAGQGPGTGNDGSSGFDNDQGGDTGSAPGLAPAPEKRGAPTEIARDGAGPSLQAQGSIGEGESTRLLARALPEWTGSALPEARVLGDYARQAESALARDEIPLELKEYVKEYFTVIGMGKGGAGE